MSNDRVTNETFSSQKRGGQKSSHERAITEIPSQALSRLSYSSSRRSLTGAELFAQMDPKTQERIARVSSDFKLQRELQKALFQLQQRNDDLQTAVEIGDSLAQDNERLRDEIETLNNQLQTYNMEIKVLTRKCEMLQQVYDEDRAVLEQDLRDQENLVNDLQQVVQDKEQELEQTHQLMQQQQETSNTSSVMDRQASQDSLMSKVNRANTEMEKELVEQLRDERKRVKDANRKIENLLQRLEDMERYKYENMELQQAIQQLEEFQEQEAMRANQTNKAISDEIVAVAKRNAALERDMEELTILLEERERELVMLQEYNEIGADRDDDDGYGMSGIGDFLADEMPEPMPTLTPRQSESYASPKAEQQPPPPAVVEKPPSPAKQPEKEKQDQMAAVPDVLKEYLHLTASAVKIKFPHITTLSSEMLIEKVHSLPFFQYHDYMVKIMKEEDKKMKQAQMNTPGRPGAQSAQSRSRGASQGRNADSGGGFFSRFTNFFRSDPPKKKPPPKKRPQSPPQKSPRSQTFVAIGSQPKSAGAATSRMTS